MKNKKENRNIRVIAENNGNKNGFNIFLDFSGQREYLMSHRHNARLYRLLKDGAVVADVRRWSPAQIGSGRVGRTGYAQLYDIVSHLVTVIDDYMMEREAS
jgi:hypothetical protein